MEEVKWEDVQPIESTLSAAKVATKKLIGMELKAAKEWLEACNVECRVLLGEQITTDVRNDRINLTVEDDMVIKAEVG